MKMSGKILPDSSTAKIEESRLISLLVSDGTKSPRERRIMINVFSGAEKREIPEETG